jgi:hypothetical protein
MEERERERVTMTSSRERERDTLSLVMALLVMRSKPRLHILDTLFRRRKKRDMLDEERETDR